MYDECALKVKINNGKLKLRHLKCPDACCLLHGVVNMITINCTLCRYKFCFRLFNLKLLTTKKWMNQIMKWIKATMNKWKLIGCSVIILMKPWGAELSTTKWLYQYLAVGGAYRNAHIWGNKHRKSAHYFNAKSTVKRRQTTRLRHTDKHVRHTEQDTSDPMQWQIHSNVTWEDEEESKRWCREAALIHKSVERRLGLFIRYAQSLGEEEGTLVFISKGVWKHCVCLNEGFHCPAIDISAQWGWFIISRNSV